MLRYGLCLLCWSLLLPALAAGEKQFVIPATAAARPAPPPQQVAAELFARFDLTRPETREYAELLRQEKPLDALSLWRDRVVARLRAHDFGEYGWHDYAIHPRSTNSIDYICGVLNWDDYIKTNMYGFVDINGISGLPGQGKLVNWYVNVDEVQNWGAEEIAAWDRSIKMERASYGNFEFAKSFTGRYWQTGKDVYPRKALELFADFSRNHARGFWETYHANQGLADKFVWETLGVDWRLNTNALQIGWRMKNFLKVLAGLAKCLGPDKPAEWKQVLGTVSGPLTSAQRDLISPAELAEIALGLERDHLSKLLWFVVPDGAVPNQRAEGLKALAFYAAIFPEFKTTPQVHEYVERGYDSFLTSNFAPDGGSLEQSFNYNGQDKEGLEQVLRFYGATRPRFADQIEAKVAARRAVDDSLQTPLGTLPQVGNSLDYPGQPVWEGEEAITRHWSLRPGPMRPQPFTSVALPYSGFYVQRSGWELKDLYLFFMNGRPQSGHSMRDNNALQLTAYGRQLLVCGGDPTYGFFRTPEVKGADFYLSEASSLKNNTVLVDGRSQSKAGKYAGRAYETPVNSRWHTSDLCDLVDGLYDLGYGEFENNRDVRVDKSVQHYRRVIFLKPAKLWLVEDRMINTGDDPHCYSQVWNFLPYSEHAEPHKRIAGFKENHFDLQPPAKVVRTTDPGGPNIELRHFGPGVDYRQYFGHRTPWLGWYGFGIGDARPAMDVHANWPSSDRDTLLTLLVPLDKGQASPVQQSQELKPTAAQTGLDVQLTGGLRLRYATAVEPQAWDMAPVQATARSLLVCSGAGSDLWGVAMGCRSLTLAGRAYPLPAEDSEFRWTGGQFSATAIHTPRVPVIARPRPFADFTHADPLTITGEEGFEVRYTLDGTEPTAASNRYDQPLPLNRPATVKARFLAGDQPLPLVASRDFRPWPWPLRKPDYSSPQGLEPGVKYDYFEHQSSIRIYDLMRRQPQRSGVCEGLDMSITEPVRFSAVRWVSYLQVPADGVYHFYLATPQTATVFIYHPARDLHLPALARCGWWGREDSGSVALQAGLHRLEVEFLREQANRMNLEIEGPGIPRQPLPKEWLWREK
jgi:hypothetical protein